MHIYVDADACPVIRQIEMAAKVYQVPVTLLCDTNHILRSDYSAVRVIEAGADSVDMALINCCRRGDIVVTQDYGVAVLALGKGARAMHQNGWEYTNDNIDRLLMERHMMKKERRSTGKTHIKGPKKRSAVDNERFYHTFSALLTQVVSNEKKLFPGQ
ncbi:MAG: YaiI/YqxD family protein [Megasphaera sp.]|nr:YaiI/YqxD family protein [Megasphaera sp.]MCI1248080.1 YaiI/YqxD family protein [Megasphaera sp.]